MDWHDHQWVEIPPSYAYLGSDDSDPFASDNEKPARYLFVDRFSISKHPTTNAQIATFFRATGTAPHPGWVSSMAATDWAHADFPATFISWDLAHAYCQWLSGLLTKPVQLPSEAQWEKAARGEQGRIWPWGDSFDARVCNSAESGRDEFCSVFDLADGASPYGIMHMAGGVWEWCVDFHHRGHNNVDLVNPIDLLIGPRRVVKGGSAYCTKEIVRPACRDWTNAVNQGGGDDGMRVVIGHG